MSSSIAVTETNIVNAVPKETNIVNAVSQETHSECLRISRDAAEAFKNFLAKNKEYLKQSAGVFHHDSHSNW